MSTNQAADVDVEVLKSEMRGIMRTVSEVNTKMDAIIGIQIQMVGLQKDVDHHRDVASRSAEAIAVVRKRIDDTESTVLQTRAMVRGAMVVGVVLMGFAQWYVLGQLAALEQVAKDSRLLERRLMLLEQRQGVTNEIRSGV